MIQHGIRSVPVVARGNRYVPAGELEQIDALFGWAPETTTLLPIEGLVERAAGTLEAAIRFARQLPTDHYDEVIPGQEGFAGPWVLPDGSTLRRVDGTTFIPHHTYRGLVEHLVGHGVKFAYLVRHPDTDLFAELATLVPLGEPSADATMSSTLAQLRASIDDIRAWWRGTSGGDLTRIVKTHRGPQTLHRLLHAQTYSCVQHTRQLQDVLGILSIDPDRPLTDAHNAGLAMPERIWG